MMTSVFPPVNMVLSRSTCDLCLRSDLPVAMCSKTDDSAVAVCEPCARMVDWFWRDVRDGQLSGVPYEEVASAALVFIVRDRFIDDDQLVPDLKVPRDVLMVPRGDEPGKYGLPGGKVERGETPTEAALRELAEETGLTTWLASLEGLYRGYTTRGRMVQVFLARAYGGELNAGEWKPWPPSQHAGIHAARLACTEEAFEARLALHAARQTESPLCQGLSRAAMEKISLAMQPRMSDSDRRHMEALSYAMTEDEKAAVKLVLRDVLRPAVPDAPDAVERGSQGDEGDATDVDFTDGGTGGDVSS
jgi:ADP-ribose pyrophosphatase YjhB (NUDIX family)